MVRRDWTYTVGGKTAKDLDTLAQALSQLQKFKFDKIGSLEFDDNNEVARSSVMIGPCYGWNEGVLGDDDYGRNPQVGEFGPFNSSKSYLQYCMNHHRDPSRRSPLAIGPLMILDRMISSCLPSSSAKGRISANQEETFVLSLPDFDSQNTMIDERGNLTGIIDWDNVETVPRFLGYSSFPGWITRDWDPLIYYYPENKESENSPEELRRCRQ